MNTDPQNDANDSLPAAGAMAIAALAIASAIHFNNGYYSGAAIGLLSVGVIAAIGGIVAPSIPWQGGWRPIAWLLAAGATVQSVELILDPRIADTAGAAVCTGMAGGFALALVLAPMRLQFIWIFTLLVAYLVVGIMTIQSFSTPLIDVYEFQHDAAQALLHGQNPYALRFKNNYPDDLFYGPGVVVNGIINYGFPYPPLTALLTVPGQFLGGDVRYGDLVAAAISAALMAWVAPGRLKIAAAVFLFMPRAFYVIQEAWTEPYVVLTFSLTMVCACRYRKGLPWALGLFLATKQYSVIALPAVPLLIIAPGGWKECARLILTAFSVAAAITLPMALWNPREFTRAVVLWQLVQPFRPTALSYLVWWTHHNGGHPPAKWIPFAAIIPTSALVLWRCRPSPAAFAAAVTLLMLVFFAVNKQAFVNYYYFTVATACWSIAASRAEPPRLSILSERVVPQPHNA